MTRSSGAARGWLMPAGSEGEAKIKTFALGRPNGLTEGRCQPRRRAGPVLPRVQSHAFAELADAIDSVYARRDRLALRPESSPTGVGVRHRRRRRHTHRLRARRADPVPQVNHSRPLTAEPGTGPGSAGT